MYNHNKIEKKWQEFWNENKTYKFVDTKTKPKFYSLDMFPYPSGKGLHVGHPKGYTATDIISRYKKLQGFDVLHPIGWDAFGLPAEQYAIDTNNDPAIFTQENINNFRNQLKKLGFCFDYDKEVNTTVPDYFKWTQWIFIQLFKKGLAEIKDVEVNWCEQLGTVLSNEEVLIDKNGNQVSERGGYPVEKRPMRQWILKITKYADKLLEGLDELDWPESLKSLQRNWIGKSVGYNLKFNLENNELEVFFNNLTEIANCEYILISPKSKILDKFSLSNDVKNYIDEFKQKNDRFIKSHKDFSGIKLNINLINPITNKKIELYLADFVYSDLNLEAVGFNFENEDFVKFAENHNLILNKLKPINKEEVLEKLGNNLSKVKKYKLKDWLFSRQRYWGEPFPIVFDENNNPYPLQVSELPLKLPILDDFKPSKEAIAPLAKATEWINVKCDNQRYFRDINTMPQWAGSCWYYLGYILKNENNYTPLNSKEAFDLFSRWLPVDLYIGGQEHAVLHLLYARFWHRFLYDINVVPTKEPFYKIINQGMILGEDGEKMSKSKGNIINPDEIIETHGADALRLYEMFMGPLTSSMPWNDEKLNGIRKWLDRVYRLYTETDKLGIEIIKKEKETNKELIYQYNLFVKKVTDNLENQQFNIAISNMMVFINEVYKIKQFNNEFMSNFLIVLSTFAPHISEELYSEFKENKNDSIFDAQWPQYNEELLVLETVNIPIMIKNKPRDVIQVPVDTDENTLKDLVLANPKVLNFIGDNEIKKIIIIKNKTVNIVI